MNCYCNDSNVTNVFSTVPYGAGKYVFSSKNNTGVWGSDNFLNFSQTSLIKGSFTDAVYENGIWLIASLDNSVVQGVYYSLDGETFIQSNLTTGAYSKPCFYNGLWVISSNLYSNGIYWSLDGIVWEQSNITSGNFNTPYFSNNIWIIGSFGSNLGIFTSLDGKEWTQNKTRNSGDYGVPIFINNTWVINSLTTDCGLIYSLDNGFKWSCCGIQNGIYSNVKYNSGVFVVGSVKDAGLFHSTNGISWFKSNIQIKDWEFINFKNGVWYSLSNDVGIIYSFNGMYWMESNVVSYKKSNNDVKNIAFIGGNSYFSTKDISFFQIPFIF